ncbi:MAG TPA: MFS transporter [Pedomonas sp.]|uniref:MFS transporter n=1 Tax=Pedomonas sp. TaxID=2976421 RepID=UPI002F421A1B
MAAAGSGAAGTFAPLREGTFRRIWSASLISNFGHLILGVAAAWEMTRLTDSAEMVALVQSALMLPLMLVSVPAGAVADMFDRRKIALSGLAFSMLSAVVLTVIALAGAVTPWVLLAFCSLIGAGVALYSPAWQASISEQVPPEQIPGAIALGTISYNIARSCGPAVGGAIVLAAGVQAAFAMNALFYVPLFIAFLMWQRKHVPARLPPERIDRAIISGGRYAMYSPSVRNTIVRAFLFGLASAATSALAALVAKDLLGGDAAVFGLLLGASGAGAVAGALLVSHIRATFRTELAVTMCLVGNAVAVALIGASHNVALTCAGMFLAGGVNILIIALFNVGVQLSVPRWVVARALSLFSASLTGGIALGAWLWGEVASVYGVDSAFFLSATVVLLSPLLGLVLPIRATVHADVELAPLENVPEVELGISMRSGPVTIEIDYIVDPNRARDFYDVMRRMQGARQRRGAFNWSLARDIGNAALWTERYQCATWGDYLRQRSRFTQADRALQQEASAFHLGGADNRVRHRLERPFGSVRWKADSPDPGQDSVDFITP